MRIDFGMLSNRLKGKTEIGLLSAEEYKDMIEPVHKYIVANHPSVTVFLLNGDEILCPLKTEKFEFFVLLGVCCPIHPFKEFVSVGNRMSPEDKAKIEKEKRCVVYDSTYSISPPLEEKDLLVGNVLVVTKSQMFYDYYFYKYDARSFYALEERSRMLYLAAKCNKGERIRSLGIFAIVFTSRVYEDLAKSIRKALVSRRKNAYLLFLKDLSYERMITIEGTECIVVIDCPVFDCGHIELHIPVVTPFEVEYALSNEWSDRFEKNSFSVSDVPISTSTELDLLDRVGRLLLRSEAQGVPFGYEEEDMEIHLGQSGTSQGYDFEGV